MLRHARLTERELQVVKLFAEGNTTPEVAELLGITLATARTHAQRVRAKLNARTMAEAVHVLHQEGLL